MEFERFTDLNEHMEDNTTNNLRPKTFDDYIGQEKLKKAMQLYIKAAMLRDEPVDHILLYGPPGLGKTSLAYVVANEMNKNIKITSGPVLEKSGDLASILTSLEDGDILFIDEIHRLNTTVEEILYPAMEDGEIDILIGKGHAAKSIRIELPRFTLIGATTNAGKLSKPLRDRFGVTHRMEMYTNEELEKILMRSASIFDISYEQDAISNMAKRSRGTPRLANRLLKRARDYATINCNGVIDQKAVNGILNLLEIDEYGLDSMDRSIIVKIIENYNGGPVGLETLSILLGEDKRTVEEVYEPYLINQGLLKRTHRGRVVTDKAYKHLGIKEKPNV
ncbi:Holliday junction branch migration DNA helicase RuvB [Caviibacter abscessus]|uniref:Holliday junction branch migration DNA helicase RuvB n=1 Tax=Caviibacter abscessus TaxID=1766719 RepID=UPI000831125A|nr:Holliday junction branch migration DNA helicase RuvB [Caviibacter abscessus]